MNIENTENGPIFIVGSPRSGTTLLQFMLRSHPNISIPTGESHFIVPIYKERNKFGDLKKKDDIRDLVRNIYSRNIEFLETDLHGIHFEIESIVELLYESGCNTIPEAFFTIFQKNAFIEGKKRWGDKTPWYIFHMPLILEMFPNARIIHIIRDGRDVALSLFGRKNDFGVYNIHSAAEYWNIYLEKGQAAGSKLSPSNYYEVRYEDILINPEKEIWKICEFVNEEYDERIVNFKNATHPGKTPLLHQPIQKNNAFKWKKLLSPRQKRIFESISWKILKRNNYEISEKIKNISVMEKFLYRLHNSICNLIFRGKLIGLKR